MTARVTQADTPPLAAPRSQQSAGRPDPEATERFRDALSRKGGKVEAKPAKLAVQAEGGEEPAAPPSGQVPLPFHVWPRKDQQQPAPPPDGQRDIGLPQGDGGGASAQPSAPATHGSAADAATFAGLVARFDAGAMPSASTHLALPGESWRAEQVTIDQQGSGLSVSIDLGHDQGDKNEALKELEARLRARGLNAHVVDASRFGEAHSRIA